MIRPLRRRHGWIWVFLSPALLVLLGAAWTARPSFPVEKLDSPITGEEVLAEATWEQESPVATRVIRQGEALVLELNPQQALQKPEVLVYWLKGEDLASGFLLGTLRGTGPHAFALPSLESSTGAVVLYSLAHQAEIDRTNLNLEAGS